MHLLTVLKLTVVALITVRVCVWGEGGGHTHTITDICLIVVSLHVYCRVGLYRLFGLSVIVVYPF